MKPKRIALIGFEDVTALHLVGPAEAFTAAALDDGYGGRIPCYDVTIVGVGSERFRGESGMTFTAEVDLSAADEFDTVIIAGYVCRPAAERVLRPDRPSVLDRLNPARQDRKSL